MDFPTPNLVPMVEIWPGCPARTAAAVLAAVPSSWAVFGTPAATILVGPKVLGDRARRNGADVEAEAPADD